MKIARLFEFEESAKAREAQQRNRRQVLSWRLQLNPLAPSHATRPLGTIQNCAKPERFIIFLEYGKMAKPAY